MKRSVKILLGLTTISPFVFAVGFFGSFIHLINTAPTQNFEAHFSKYAAIMNFIALLFTLSFSAIWVFFLVHAARNPHLDAMRTTWLVALILLGPW